MARGRRSKRLPWFYLVGEGGRKRAATRGKAIAMRRRGPPAVVMHHRPERNVGPARTCPTAGPSAAGGSTAPTPSAAASSPPAFPTTTARPASRIRSPEMVEDGTATVVAELPACHVWQVVHVVHASAKDISGAFFTRAGARHNRSAFMMDLGPWVQERVRRTSCNNNNQRRSCQTGPRCGLLRRHRAGRPL